MIAFLANHAQHNDARTSWKTVFSVQVDIQHDSESSTSRSSQSRGNDQKKFLRKCFATAIARTTKTGDRGKLFSFILFCSVFIGSVFQSEKSLSSLPNLDCAVCQVDIDLYYDESLKIVEESQKLLSIALEYPQGSRTLGAGRVVILRDEVCILSFSSLDEHSIP